MVDKLVLLNKHTLVVVYSHRPAVTIRSDEDALQLWDWLRTETPQNLQIFNLARANESEETCPAIVLNAA